MLTKHTLRDLTWIDLESPTAEEIREIMETYRLHPLAADELLAPTVKPRVDQYGHFIYLILHFPALKHTHAGDRRQEVDFIIGRDFIITTRYDTIDPLHKFAKVFEVEAVRNNKQGADDNAEKKMTPDIQHAGHIFFFMIRKLYRAVQHELEFITDELSAVEERIFQGHEKEMVMELSKTSRHLLDFKQTLTPHRDMLDSFKDVSVEFFDDAFVPYAKAVLGECYRVWAELRNNLEMLSELRETNNSLVSTKQNEVMKILTIMAFVTFPLSLIASIFGMNTHFLPIVGHPNDFWIVTGIMGALTACFFVFFKYKKWL